MRTLYVFFKFFLFVLSLNNGSPHFHHLTSFSSKMLTLKRIVSIAVAAAFLAHASGFAALRSSKTSSLFLRRIPSPPTRNCIVLSESFSSFGKRSSSSASDEGAPGDKQQFATLRIKGPDKTGIVAAFAQTLAGHGCSIYDAEQSTDRAAGLFFQRIRFDYTGMLTDRHTLTTGVVDVCRRLQMTFQLDWGDTPKRVAIIVSKYDHCL
jgi:hypothetical protein